MRGRSVAAVPVDHGGGRRWLLRGGRGIGGKGGEERLIELTHSATHPVEHLPGGPGTPVRAPGKVLHRVEV